MSGTAIDQSAAYQVDNVQTTMFPLNATTTTHFKPWLYTRSRYNNTILRVLRLNHASTTASCIGFEPTRLCTWTTISSLVLWTARERLRHACETPLATETGPNIRWIAGIDKNDDGKDNLDFLTASNLHIDCGGPFPAFRSKGCSGSKV